MNKMLWPDDATEVETLVELLRWRAQYEPDRRVYTFLVDGETEEVNLTYGELDRRARSIGAVLQDSVPMGERVLLIHPPGLEYIAGLFGCLYAGVIAVPAYPPHSARRDRIWSRLQAIVHEAQPVVALATSATQPLIEKCFAEGLFPPTMRWLATDTITDETTHQWHELAITGDTLALLQYTSGSTAAPRGVMVSHGNLWHNSAQIYHCFGNSPETRGMVWLPPYHDMGLIGGVMQPLYGGLPVTIMSPVAFLQRPFRWLQAISRSRATTSGGPNFAYDLCVRKVTLEQRDTLDLSCWQLAFNGAEPVRHETLERFTEAFAPCGFRWEAFYPCYGLAEATLIVSGGNHADPPILYTVDRRALEQHRVVEVPENQEQAQTLVGCGQTVRDQKIVIVDPDSLVQCLPDQVGEIWVSGPSVAQGYWNRTEDTAQTFQAHLADTGEGPFLRTGDLGFLKDGELFITGRLKDLLIIRGQNHYPQDIERTVERSHPALRPDCGAAFVVEIEGDERLVIAQEVERSFLRSLNVDEVVGNIREAVAAQHALQVFAVFLLKPGSIPKTSSGKIQRQACRTGFLNGSLSQVTDGEAGA